MIDSPKSFDQILKYIVYKCRENKYPVADSLIAYILNIMYSKEKDSFYFADSMEIGADSSKMLIDEVMELLYRKKDGILETLKLQQLYEISHIEEEEKVKVIKGFFDKETGIILDEIKSYEPNRKKDYDTITIYKKIFNFNNL